MRQPPLCDMRYDIDKEKFIHMNEKSFKWLHYLLLIIMCWGGKCVCIMQDQVVPWLHIATPCYARIIREVILDIELIENDLDTLLSHDDLLITRLYKGESIWIDFNSMISCQTLSVQGIFFRRYKLFVVRCLVSPSNRQTRPIFLSFLLSFFLLLIIFLFSKNKRLAFYRVILPVIHFPAIAFLCLLPHPSPSPLGSLLQIPTLFLIPPPS